MSVIVEATSLPLAEPPLPQADPCVIVIFGALGDLTKRKLVPALFYLARAGCLSSRFKVLGIGRAQLSDDEFRAELRAGATGSKEMGEFSDAQWQAFAPCLRYQQGNLDDS